jgi:hypothetical protein
VLDCEPKQISALPAAGLLRDLVSSIRLLRQWWPMPKPRPVIEVEHLVSINQQRVAWLVWKIIETDSPSAMPDGRLADDITRARRFAPTNRTPQPWMPEPVI